MLKNFTVLVAILCNVDAVIITFNTKTVLHETSSRFLGVTIDSGVIRRNWETFAPRSTKVQALAAALSPCYLRMGGNDADFLIFDDSARQSSVNIEAALKYVPASKTDYYMDGDKHTEDNTSGRYKSRQRRDVGYEDDPITNFTMSAEFYDEIHKFVNSVGWDLIFDLNVLLRSNGHWDPTNALKLFQYTVAKGYKMAGWELGNEPNLFADLVANYTLAPERLVQDFMQFKEIVRSYPEFVDTVILGPSVAQSAVWTKSYFKSFLNSGGGNIVTASSFHQYYIKGATATVEQFYDSKILNLLLNEVMMGVNLTRASGSKASVWLGETSSAWGGGAPGLSDRYVAGFMWLDKLGMAARHGLSVVIRQSFYGGHYALIDSQTLDPNPDYWLSLLYKLLVGPKVFGPGPTEPQGKLRYYAQCTATSRSGYAPGSMTVMILNLDTSNQNVTVSSEAFLMHVYSLLPAGGDLKSQQVMLNGKLLELQDDQLPNLLIPVKLQQTWVLIPATSFGFIVFPEVNLDVCM